MLRPYRVEFSAGFHLRLKQSDRFYTCAYFSNHMDSVIRKGAFLYLQSVCLSWLYMVKDDFIYDTASATLSTSDNFVKKKQKKLDTFSCYRNLPNTANPNQSLDSNFS